MSTDQGWTCSGPLRSWLSSEVMILSLGLEWLCTQSKLQGSQQLFLSDSIINGARQSALTIGTAHFSIVLLQCHKPSSTPFPWAGVGQESSRVWVNHGKAARSQQRGQEVHFTALASGLNPAWQNCATSTTQVRKRCCHLCFCALLQKTNVKWPIQGSFQVPWPTGQLPSLALVTWPWDQSWQN